MSNTKKRLFTSESVTEGHPDKIADQISDAVLDAVMTHDPMGRVACESLVTTGLIVIAGEITTECYVDFAKVARQVVRDVGYTRAKYGFDADTCGVMSTVDEQSRDIAMGVDTGGAGDQGMMFGFACRETPELMPLPITLAHQLCQRLSVVRRQGVLDYLRPDGKSQVTVEYEGDRPVRLDAIVVSTQHSPDASQERIREDVIKHVIREVVPAQYIDDATKFHVNPTGRYVAKNVVAAGIADRAEVQLAYAIGVADPVSVNVNTYGTGKVGEDRVEELIRSHFALTPRGIIESLDLRRPIYRATAAFGHFGRTGDGFTWERTDKAAALKKDAGL